MDYCIPVSPRQKIRHMSVQSKVKLQEVEQHEMIETECLAELVQLQFAKQ